MNKFGAGALALMLSTTVVSAGGLDRSGQSIGILFKDNNYAELSFGHTTPTVSGTDVFSMGGTGNVGLDFNTIGAGIKLDMNDKISFALIFDQPYGSDVQYPVQATSPLLGGTKAIIDS